MPKNEKKNTVTKVIVDDLSWTKTTESELKTFPEKTKKIIADNLSYFKLAKVSENASFKTVLHTREILFSEISRMARLCGAFEMMHKDESVRNTARKISLEISKMMNDLTYNEDLYESFKNYYDKNYKTQKRNKELTDEEIYIVEETQKGYKKIGMDLPKDKKKRLIVISNKMDKLAQEFELDCVKKYEKGIWFLKSDLDGLSEGEINNFKTEVDKKGVKKYFVSMKPADIDPIRRRCAVRTTREKVVAMLEQGAGEKNTKRMLETLKLRKEVSDILGFDSFAHMATDEQIVKGEKNVIDFIKNLIKKLSKKYELEKKGMVDFLKSRNEKLDSASVNFSLEQIKSKNSGVDTEEFRQYFELENSINSMWSIWEKLFGLKVIQKNVISEFDPEVKVYDVVDVKTNKIISTVVLDLFPRIGKYGHACVATFGTRYTDLEKNIHTGTYFLICNFSKDKSGKTKTLLTPTELETLFHEGGHLLHAVLSQNTYKATSWGGVSTDFVEIPSQTLEKFARTEAGLNYVSKHYITGKKLPKSIIQKIDILSKESCYSWYRQFGFSLVDIILHGKKITNFSGKPESLHKHFNDSMQKTLGIKNVTDTKYMSGFAHLMHGYESRYYSYVVSKVYADDVWSEFISSGITKSASVKKYKEMLESGAMLKEDFLLKRFLGRKPNDKAFIKNLQK